MNVGLGAGVAATLVAVWLSISFVLARTRTRRLRALAARRGPYPFTQFKESFPGAPETLLAEAYQLIQRLIDVDGFPVYADDYLWTTLDLDQGDLENEVVLFLEKRGLKVSNPPKPLETVGDLVNHLLAAWPGSAGAP